MKRIQAFSLIELMVIVAILSLAAALIIPRFLRHQEEIAPPSALSKKPL